MRKDSVITISVKVASQAETEQLARDIAITLSGGATIHLSGDLGSGKSVLARAMIRHVMQDKGLEVPSPTFSLVQHYSPQNGPAEILHADLYRIGDASECSELGLSEAMAASLVLVEWPERGAGNLPQPDLKISIDDSGMGSSESRQLTLAGQPEIMARIHRSLTMRSFLDEHWGKGVDRRPLQGDASTRSYEITRLGGEMRILMNAPRQPDGPPIRDGKPYSRIAHLAEDVTAFAGVQAILADCGLAVPAIHAADLDAGLLLLEHLGTGQIIDAERKPIADRYMECAALLAGFHGREFRREHDLGGGHAHRIPAYDRDALSIETELLIDWYAPRFCRAPLAPADRDAFKAIWNRLFDRLQPSHSHLCMRDFHSPNIIFRQEKEGTDRIGLIDFQDAVAGPSSYDLASLAQDARVDVPSDLENALVDHYCMLRGKEASFEEAAFRESYAIMAAQRATKILGIFVRLDERDGKPAYLAHLPRLQDYLSRSFRHPVLAEYRDWFAEIIGALPSAAIEPLSRQ